MFGRYLRIFLVALLAVLAAVAAFNAAIDPFDVFGSPHIPGVNAGKPWAVEHTFMTKSAQLARLAPRTVIFGTSRADLGLDPASPAWPDAGRPVYDFGIAGNGLPGIARNLEQAIAGHDIKAAVIVLDMEALLGGTQGYAPWSPQPWLDHAQELADSTLTLSALVASLGTVATQRSSSTAQGIAPNGLTDQAQMSLPVQSEGYGTVFMLKERQFEPQLREMARRWVGHEAALSAQDAGVMRMVRDMLAQCRARGVAVVIIIPPAHAARLESF